MIRRRTTAGVTAGLLIVLAIVACAQSRASLGPLPRGWPSTLAVGIQAEPDGGGTPSTSAPATVRYHYLSGGVAGDGGWRAWGLGDGNWTSDYATGVQAAGALPVFSYYQLLQSSPLKRGDEAERDRAALADRATMAAYLGDLRALFESLAASGPAVVQIEPDLWGYMQVRAEDDDAATVPARVADSGVPELAGLPNTVAGLAQAIVRLRDRYARNVTLGYHLSPFGTGKDIQLSHPTADETERIATRSAAFYHSLNARFDVLFAEFANDDFGYRQVVESDGGASRWNADDFDRFAAYLASVVRATRRRVVLWQIPLGNTYSRTMNNTRGHYQDNRVQSLLGSDPAAKARLRQYTDAGVIGLLFGRAHATGTCACDAERDGVTNPLAIGANRMVAKSADDDGGYFAARARAYARTGGLPLAP